MKKIIPVIAALIVSAAFAVPCGAADISAETAIVTDGYTGEILYEKSSGRKMEPASITKIVTALVALDKCDIDETVTVSGSAAGTEGSSLYLEQGEKVGLEALLYGMMLESGNDAAQAIAEHISGSGDKFAVLMNEKAQALGCTGTNFENPSGLPDDNHCSTAADMAKIAAAFINNPTLYRIASTTDVIIGGKHFTNHNKLLAMYPGCVGIKTGYTKSAGRTLVSCCERDGRRLICVTMNDGNDWQDHISLYEMCFNSDKKAEISEEKLTFSVPVAGGVSDSVEAVPERETTIILPENDKPEYEIRLNKMTFAPVKKGAILGSVKIKSDGQTIYETNIIAAEQIDARESEIAAPIERTILSFGGIIDYFFGKLGYAPQ